MYDDDNWSFLMIFVLPALILGALLLHSCINKNSFMECIDKGMSEEFCKENFLDKELR